jgi:hypothetical protein
MNKFETKIKKALKIEAEQSPDYWESISKKTNIPYNGGMIMKKTTKSKIFKLRYAVPAVCGLALVVMFTFINFQSNKPSDLGGDVIGNQTVENLNINNILSSMSAKIRLPENGTTETLSYDAYLEKAGMNLELELPAGLENTDDAYVYYNEDGSEFMMSGFTFHNPSTGAYLTIRFQKEALPITDTRFQLEKQEVSTINGEDIVIGYNKELDTYFTTFMYQGIGYELNGVQGISQEDFISVIQSILQ